MPHRQFLVFFILSISLLIIILRMIQKKYLDIAYCWVWLFIGTLAPLLVVKLDWLIAFSQILGVVTPSNALFLFAILFLFIVCLQFSVVISKQRRQIKTLAQELALLSKKDETSHEK